MNPDRLSYAAAAPAVRRSPGRRLLDRLLARPSIGALVGVGLVLLIFAPQAPGLLSTGGLATVLGALAQSVGEDVRARREMERHCDDTAALLRGLLD